MAHNTDISTYPHNDVTLVFKIHIKLHNLPVTESQNGYKLDSFLAKMAQNVLEWG